MHYERNHKLKLKKKYLIRRQGCRKQKVSLRRFTIKTGKLDAWFALTVCKCFLTYVISRCCSHNSQCHIFWWNLQWNFCHFLMQIWCFILRVWHRWYVGSDSSNALRKRSTLYKNLYNDVVLKCVGIKITSVFVY